MRIYIIDDDYGDVQQLRGVLMALPSVKSAAAYYGFDTAKELLDTYYEDDVVAYPDLVVVEAKLNKGSSPELVRLIRGCKGMASIPILIYTNSDDEELRRTCVAAGATKIFPKGPGKKGAEEVAAYVAGLPPKP